MMGSQLILFLLLRIAEVYSFLLVVYALMSWFPQLYGTRLGRLVTWLVRPILKPFERLPLQFYGVDLSVLVALLSIRFGTQLLVWLVVGFLW